MGDPIFTYLPLLSFALIILGFLSTVFVMWLRRYERVADPEYLIEEKYKEGLPEEETFFDDIILDLALATNTNKIQNAKRARWFQVAVLAVFGGIATNGIIILRMIY